MSQPPYGEANQPRQPDDEPYAYPPPVDPFATAPQPIITPRSPAAPQSPPGPDPTAAQPTSGQPTSGQPTSPYPYHQPAADQPTATQPATPWPPRPPQPGMPPQPPSGPPGYPPQPPSGPPGYPPQPPSGPPGYPPQPPSAGPAYPPPGHPQGYDATAAYPAMLPGFGPNPGQPPAPPKKSRGRMIAAIVLGVAVLLCGGGGTAAYLLLKDSGGRGEADPKAAVQTFLTAVYEKHDAARANEVVCADSRDKEALTKKVDGLKATAEKHKDAKYAWREPTVTEQKGERATVTTTVRMTTGDEKLSEQTLTFVVVKDTKWFVCEVRSTS